MTKQEFIEKYAQPNMAVHCKTEYEAKELLEMADEFGFKWITGEKFTKYTNWNINKKYTCYYIRTGMYGNAKHKNKYNDKIVEFKED